MFSFIKKKGKDCSRHTLVGSCGRAFPGEDVGLVEIRRGLVTQRVSPANHSMTEQTI